MKKTISGFVTAVLFAFTIMLPFSDAAAAAGDAAEDTCEYAWFPLYTMAITQISFESESHGNSYHMDCSGRYEQCAFAPFTGRVVYASENYGLVLFQSAAPVHYADGSIDYMTAVFMHADNTDELSEYCREERLIPQGTNFLRCGGIGKNGAVEYAVHYDIGVYRGQISSPNGYYSRIGNTYPFDGFYLNPKMTPSIVNKGHLASDNQLMRGEYNNWDSLWVTLPEQDSETQPSADTETTKPERPVLSIRAGSDAEPVIISFQQCANTTYYNTRIYDSTRTIVYCIGLCEDAVPFGECRLTDSTDVYRQLAAGSYQVMVTAVNRATGECTASEMYRFEVTRSEKDHIAQLQDYFACCEAMTTEQASALDLNQDGRLNAADLTLVKRAKITG